MGYKRCLEVIEFEGLCLNKAKRFECNNECASFADIDSINNTFVRSDISGEDEGGFYNIQWYDAPEADTANDVPRADGKDVGTGDHFSSCSTEDDSRSVATSLSSTPSDCLEFDIPPRAFVPPGDAFSALDCSPRKPVPVGLNHQATIPIWNGRVNKKLTGTDNHGSPFPGLASVHTVDDYEERLMGTSVLSMPNSSFYSFKGNNVGEGKIECNCLNQGSIRCVQQHVRQARENMRKALGNENFLKLGFCDMGEEVALKWTEEEEEIFHEVVCCNATSLGRNFWKHLSIAFPSRTNKEIVGYYFNVFTLRRRAAQNRSRFLDIDNDDDECHIRNAGFYGFEISEEEDSAIESLCAQDVRVENQDNYCDEDDDTDGNIIGFAGYDMGNNIEEEVAIDQRSFKCGVNLQVESCGNAIRLVNGTLGIPKDDMDVQYDSCMSFECDTDIDVSCYSHGLVDAYPVLQGREFKCDESPRMPGKLDLSSTEMENAYLLEFCDAKDWYPGYSTDVAADIDFLPASNLIEEFFGHGTHDKRTRSD